MRLPVRPIEPGEDEDWNLEMERHHPLGNPHIAGHRIKYVAEKKGKPIAFAWFSAILWAAACR